jgi:hypothetical protein
MESHLRKEVGQTVIDFQGEVARRRTASGYCVSMTVSSTSGFVFALIDHRNPCAVFEPIALIHIDPLKRVAGRAWSHIFDELNRVMPSPAHLNSSVPVMLKALISRIFASAYSIKERLNGASRVGVFGKSVSCLPSGKKLCAQAPAALRSASYQAPAISLVIIPAFAAAKPNNISRGRLPNSTDNRQPPECLSGSIYGKCHQ